MNDEISIPVSLPLDGDGFLRRECPNCEEQFKWFPSESEEPGVTAHQYFCPLCGVAAGLDSWWTPEQLAYAQAVAAPEVDRVVQDSLSEAFKGIKGLSYKPASGPIFEAPMPGALVESDDMVIVQPPCHPHEPIKVPEQRTLEVHCLLCGERFAA